MCPALTTVAQPGFEIGHAAVQHLIGMREIPREASDFATGMRVRVSGRQENGG
ncbi:hypothetical protein Q4543_18175 [Salipiger sp. 1_MG-2023]|uniref:hypothetical protein n=1 Tax=Salipiger sp. 1_MG-2023 TaxID=3062665 RepID=UPI0026E1F510|nr:hypothetical protein [Salipiger sp. 1_MG-2023]MDO6587443.1 hypothetical protein [Salipiger sp. 1_MG-2023]